MYSNMALPKGEESRDLHASSKEGSHAELLNREVDLIEFGPVSSELDFISKYMMLNDPIYKVLQCTWYLSDLSREKSLVEHVIQIGLAKGYEEYEAVDFANEFEKSVMKGKYKPVAKEVVPISVHNPDSIVPEYKTIEVGVLPSLPFHPHKFEDTCESS